MKKITITRKIKLNIIEDIKEGYEKLYNWREEVFRSANTAISHLYFQRNMNDFFYLTEEAKILFADINKADPETDEDKIRVLNTSKQNTTYRLLSSKLKGKMPSIIFSALNSQLVSLFKKEGSDYFSGKRSLRTYRKDTPIPFTSQNIKIKEIDGIFYFELFKIKFKTYLGKDLSDNKSILQRVINGEYKLCDSSIKLDSKDIYLLAVIQFDSLNIKLDKNKVMEAELSPYFPILSRVNKKEFKIGNKEEYLHRRLAIQGALKRVQIASRYNKNGKGRKKKMSNIDRFHKKETNYINTKQHQYSHKLIDLCIKEKCGVLKLNYVPDLPDKKETSKAEISLWKKENQPLLRNWSYYGLSEKIKYKCDKFGIELITE